MRQQKGFNSNHHNLQNEPQVLALNRPTH